MPDNHLKSHERSSHQRFIIRNNNSDLSIHIRPLYIWVIRLTVLKVLLETPNFVKLDNTRKQGAKHIFR